MKFGQPRGIGGEVGLLLSMGRLMIGRWKKWEGYFVIWKERW